MSVTHHDADTIDPRNRPIADDEVVMLLVQPGLRPALFAFLKACDLNVGYAPFLSGEEGLAVFIAAPSSDDPKANPVDRA